MYYVLYIYDGYDSTTDIIHVETDEARAEQIIYWLERYEPLRGCNYSISEIEAD